MTEPRKPFLPLEERLPILEGGGWHATLRKAVEDLMGLPEVRRRMDLLAERVASGEETFRAMLEVMEIELEATGVVEAIPSEGPVVLIANHPLGGPEPLALSTLALRARSDFKVLGNVEVGALAGIEEWLLPLEILDGEGAVRRNLGMMKRALTHLREGGVLGVFPAGAVSHWQWKTARVEDPSWFSHTARIVKKSGASVLPIRFFGQNGPVFQFLGMVHPLLRSALIPRAFLAMRGRTLRCRAGKLLNRSELPGDPDETNSSLRAAVYGVFPGDGN